MSINIIDKVRSRVAGQAARITGKLDASLLRLHERMPSDWKMEKAVVGTLREFVTSDHRANMLRNEVLDPAIKYVKNALETRKKSKEYSLKFIELFGQIEPLLQQGKSEEAQPLFSKGIMLFVEALLCADLDQGFKAEIKEAALDKENVITPQEYLARKFDKTMRIIKAKYFGKDTPMLLWQYLYLATLFKISCDLSGAKSQEDYVNVLNKLGKKEIPTVFLNGYQNDLLVGFIRNTPRVFLNYKDVIKGIWGNPMFYYPAAVISFPAFTGFSVRALLSHMKAVELFNHSSQIVSDLIFVHLDRIYSSASFTELARLLGNEMKEAEQLPAFYAVYALATLAKFNLPLIELAKGKTINTPPGRVNIAISGGVGEDNITLLMQAARHPEAFPFMVVGREWFGNNYSQMQVEAKRGIVVKDGRLVYGQFLPPVPVDYRVNYDNLNSSVERAFKIAEVPKSGDSFMTELSEEKDIMNMLMQESGLNIPPWISIVGFPKAFHNQIGKRATSIKVLNKEFDGDVDWLVKRFLVQIPNGEVVIKPTAGMCGRDVSFFKWALYDQNRWRMFSEIVDAVGKIVSNGENVILQKRVFAPELIINGRKYDSNLRVFVSRNQNDQPKVSAIAVRIDDRGGPVNLSLTASALTFDDYCKHLGIEGETKDKLIADIEKQAIGAFEVLHRRVKDFDTKPHRIDFAGVDIILESDQKGGFVPQIIEINDYHSGGMWDLDQVAPPEEKGQSTRLFIETMLRRGREYKLRKPGLYEILSGLVFSGFSDS